MSKIVTAVNSMIQSSDKITDVILGDNVEYFFLYKGKYKWSMRNNEGSFYLYFYPSTLPLKDIATFNGDWGQLGMVVYSADDLGGREATESFKELYGIIKEKVYGMDVILDDIIGDML